MTLAVVRRSAVCLVIAAGLAACAPVAPSDAAPSAPASAVPSASALTLADARDCPVTKPVAAPAAIGDRLFGAASAAGNDDLWVGGLGEDGIIVVDDRFIEDDGSVGWKLGWWRFRPGTLTIVGRRLDARAGVGAEPLRSVVADGYGTSGFQATSVYFPTDGCWQVTGTVAGSELTFVTFVLRTA